jgi:hypothetical protein
MTRDEVIDAFQNNKPVRVIGADSYGTIRCVDDKDQEVVVANGSWTPWAQIEVLSEEEAARLSAEKAAAEAGKQERIAMVTKACAGVLKAAPPVLLSEAALEKVKEDRRNLRHRVVGVFEDGAALVVSEGANGTLKGFCDPRFISVNDFTLVDGTAFES